MGKQADIHVKILTASSTDELMGVYDGWADAYEQELLEELLSLNRKAAVWVKLMSGIEIWSSRAALHRAGTTALHRAGTKGHTQLKRETTKVI